MGYILPIDHNAYHNQIKVSKRKNTKSVEKIYKATLERQHQNLKNKYDRLNHHTTQTPDTTQEQKIGKHVNERV